MVDKDPWMLDEETAKKFESESKGKSAGTLCPKKMGTGPCKACEAVAAMFNSQREDQVKIARRIKAKQSLYGNFVNPANKEKQIVVEMGPQAGGKLVDKIKTGVWRDIAHPIGGKGRCVIFNKRHVDGNNKYDVEADLEKADWDVPKTVLDNLNDLDNIVEVVNSGGIYRISELKVDESLKMRLLPHWKGEQGRIPMAFIWRHWGVTQAQIDGTEPITMEAFEERAKDGDKPPWEVAETKPNPSVTSSKKKCFGRKEFLDQSDPVCTEQCADYKPCIKACS